MKHKITGAIYLALISIIVMGCSIGSAGATPTTASTKTNPTHSVRTETETPLTTPSHTAPPTETTTEPPAETNSPSPNPTETPTQTVTDYTLDISQIIASGFNRPVTIANAGDGSNRLFIVEQGGVIRIIENGSVLPEPFLNLSGMLSGGSEQGLLGLAFHPDYESNGTFVVDFTDFQGNTQIVRYLVSEQPNLADADSAVTVLSVAQPYSNHNGGQIAFGPDGYLYIALGDGGSANDPQNNAQDLSTPLGAILRIELQMDGSYTIPDTNPFSGEEDADGRIWAWGLRNPWRFSFDRQQGDLYIADVGQGLWEEIHYQPADSPGGLNYGWRCLEGAHENINQPPCDDPQYTSQFIAPVAEYSHQLGRSITGGYVYRGSNYPFLNGKYFYGDYGSGFIWSIQLLDDQEMTWSEPALELQSGINISSFGEDENGEIYIADYSGGTIRLLAAVPQ